MILIKRLMFIHIMIINKRGDSNKRIEIIKHIYNNINKYYKTNHLFNIEN
jgi:hypothetical protein